MITLTLFSSNLNQQKVNPKTGEVSDTPVGMMDVYQELNELSEKFRIMKFKSKVGSNLSYSIIVFFWWVACLSCLWCLYLSVCRKWTGTTPLKFLMCPVSVNTWKSDIL